MENENREIKLLTDEEASEKFYAAMVAAARKRQLPCVRVGNRIFFEYNSLCEFFTNQLSASAPTPQRSRQEENDV